LFVHDPTFQQAQHQRAAQQAGPNPEKGGATLRRLAGEMGQVMRIPTFGIIIIQVCVCVCVAFLLPLLLLLGCVQA
jgi:hypothetical protein